MRRATLLAAILIIQGAWPASGGDTSFFEAKIRPVLIERCYRCHAVETGKAKGGLTLDTRDGVRKGGDTGPAVVPGKPDESLLLAAIRYHDDALKMPPKAVDRLDAAQIADFERWIKEGAEDPRASAPVVASKATNLVQAARTYWAFQPIADPSPPAVRDASWLWNDIDRFVLAGLDAKGLAPAPDADRRTLIRRVTFDLTGLPPTPEEVDAFEADRTPGAFEAVVDRLLASRSYGERWGRHWLDLVRYADTSGCNADFPVPQSAKYRDYVIDAFNRDKPYDRFLREQLAGDLLPARTDGERRDGIVATGYLAIARRFGSHNEEFHLTIDDEIDNLGKVVLGLSVSCARCHDHKFDPILQRDYYALYGIFASTKHAFAGTELPRNPKDFVALGGPEEERTLKALEREVIAVERKDQRLLEEKAKAPAKTDKTPPGTRTRDVVTAEYEVARLALRKVRIECARIDKAYAVSEGTVADTQIHKKGNPKDRGETVRRGFLAALGGQSLPPDANGSGRLELAGWLTDPKNPLTPRVMANRIWQGHFGRGIVASLSDFGIRGERPSHPELLDWLASRFLADGWSIKAMHRRLVLSHAYAMASEGDPYAGTLDPNNAMLSHISRRRLSAEEIRDAMLAVSGRLDRSVPGPHPFPRETDWYFTQHNPFVAVYESSHRSVYLMQQRIKKHPFLEVFDGADPNVTTADRPLSTTALQALFLMNDPFAHAQADALAGRLLESQPDERGRIDLAHRLLFSRPATAEDLALARAYLEDARTKLAATDIPDARRDRAALASYARVLLSSNEFLHVD
jgi:hypothetical protein